MNAQQRRGAYIAAVMVEGNVSQDHQRKVHERFLTRERSRAMLPFTEETPAACEEFEVVNE